MVIDVPMRGVRRVPDTTLVRRLRSLSDRTEPTDAVVAVTRGLVSAAVCWQLLWFVAQPSLHPNVQSTPAAAIAVTSVIVLAVVLLLAHVIGRRHWSGRIARVNVIVILLATGVVNLSQARSPEPDWQRVAELAALAAGVAGLLLSTRWGLISTAVMTALLLRDVLLPDWSGQMQAPLEAVLDPFYVMAMGLSSVAAKRVLLANAAAADDAATDLLRAEQERHTADVVAQRLRETERRLHESVLNTLVAIARGGLGPEWRTRIALRCEEGARLLESLSSRSTSDQTAPHGAGSLEADLADIVADLRSAGVDVRWTAQDVDIPEDVHRALRTACAEALINVGRHADASTVEVEVVSRRARGRRGVGVVIRDDGRGFSPVQADNRFGLTDAIAGPMVDIGGTAVVHSAPGDGTQVDLGWWSRPRPADEQGGTVMAPAPAALAIPVLVVLAVYTSVMVLVTRGFVIDPVVNAIAFAIWLAIAFIVAIQSRRGALQGYIVILVAACGWLTFVLQESATASDATAGWSSPAIAGLFLVVAAIGPSWGWVVLLLTWLVFQGDPLGELTQPGTAMILVGALLGRSLRRNAHLAWEHRSAEVSEESAGRDARASIDQIASRYRRLRESSAPDLLQAVAQGRVDPADPELRADAAREERFIRNVMRHDPADGPINALAAELVSTAHARRALLDVDLTRQVSSDLDLDPDVRTWFSRVMQHACPTSFVDGRPQGSTARLSLREESGCPVLRLIVPMSDVPDVAGARDVVRGQLVDPDDPAGEIWLWETSVPFIAGQCRSVPFRAVQSRSEPFRG